MSLPFEHASSQPAGTNTAERFGYEWGKYDAMLPHYEEQFLGWTRPLGRHFWAGKRILDAGCGMGRNSFWPLQYGAREVVAFDFDERTVAAARRLLARFPNARVEYQSIYDITYAREFDCVYSIGVIHHLERPAQALAGLVRAVKPGGKLLVWLYAREGNRALLWWLLPLRAVTSRLPVGLVHAVSYFLSVPLWLGLRLHRPRSPYLARIARYPFRHVHGIVFDQLFPRIAHYWRRGEVDALFRGLPLTDVRIEHTDGYSWTVTATA